MRAYLFRIFGWRIALQFGCISLVFSAVLAALYLTSGYAVKGYVADQIGRIPWDLAISQRDALVDYPAFHNDLTKIPGTQRVESFGMLRVANTGKPIRIELNGVPVPAQWLVIVTSSDPELLPPQFAAQPGNGAIQAAVLRVRDAKAAPVPLPGGSLVLHKTGTHRAAGHTHDDAPSASHNHGDDNPGDFTVRPDAPDNLFEATIKPPVSIEREEFNRWLLRNVGSLSYLPEQAIIVVVSPAEFIRTATTFQRSFGDSTGMHGGTAAPPYIPELTHLVHLDRSRWIDPWRFDSSLSRLYGLQMEALRSVQSLTIFSNVTSDSFTTLTHMRDVSKMIGIITLLVAVPLLWLGWAVANLLGRLLLMNERRIIGLAIIRGIPAGTISGVLLGAILIGGTIGGVLGLGLGTLLTVIGHAVVGQAPPPMTIILGGSVYYALFAVISVALTVFSAWGVIREIRKMSPREAVSYVTSDAGETASGAAGRIMLALSIVALVLGGIRLIEWTTGVSFILSLAAHLDAPWSMALRVLSVLLNFFAIPLFLSGIAGLLSSRGRVVELVLNAIAAPVAGKMRWFVAQHMAINRRRVAGTLFVTSLAMSLALLPQVTADSFHDRLLRGVAAAVGADVQLEYSMPALARLGDTDRVTPADAQARMAPDVNRIEQAIRRAPGVTSVSVIDQMVAPDVYVPNQSGLFVNIIHDPQQYLQMANFEEGLGLTRKFSDIISDRHDASLAASAGLFRVRQVALGHDVIADWADPDPVKIRFNDVLALLPGQPSVDVAQREGYAAAEVDYLNYLLGTDVRAVSTAAAFKSPGLARLKLQPSKTVFLVRMADGAAVTEDSVAQLVAGLPIKPQLVRSQASERRRLSSDMFVSLALANLSVFMIGGLVLAVAGVAVIGIANILAERRTLALLRLRGIPASTLFRLSLSIFLSPVAAGILLGIALGLIAGLGLSAAVWAVPRVYGVAGLLANRIDFTPASAAIIGLFAITLLLVAFGFAAWPFRGTANESFRKSHV